MSKQQIICLPTLPELRAGVIRKATKSFLLGSRVSGQNLSLVAALAFPFLGQPAIASSPDTPTCDQAASLASAQTAVPLEVLLAVTRNETGRKRNGRTEPWPWTVNMEGDGFWFDTEDQAQAFVFEHFKIGARSFDVGCFQINYKWHGAAFNSIEEMFDPTHNAIYAAQFLSSLYEETGDWLEAVGAYHSRTPEYAARYKRTYQTILTSLEPSAAQAIHVATTATPERENTFPLLAPRAAKTVMGSLVPLSQERRASASLFSPEG